jgi:hypothetical protein
MASGLTSIEEAEDGSTSNFNMINHLSKLSND